MTYPTRYDDPIHVEVRFTSDWLSASTSQSHPLRDAVIDRDDDGFPVLAGSVLRGVLSDAALTIADGLHSGASGPWHRWRTDLFGRRAIDPHAAEAVSDRRPVEGRLQSARLSVHPEVRAALVARREAAGGPEIEPAFRDALTLTRQMTRLDDDRMAVKNTLRIQERAPAPMSVFGTWRIRSLDDPPGAVPWQHLFLLAGAARLVAATGVGSSTNRGVGECSVHLWATDADGALVDVGEHFLDEWNETLLTDTDDAHAAAPPARHDPPAVALTSVAEAPLRHAYDVTIRLDAAAVFESHTQGNLIRGHDHIPGAAVLSILGRATSLPLASLLAAQAIVVTDATPVVSGTRTVRLPISLVPVTTLGSSVDVRSRLTREDAAKGRVDGFVTPTTIAGQFRFAEPDVVRLTRAAHDPQSGRTTSRSGGPFTMEAIAAGQIFRAQVWLPPGVALSAQDREALAATSAMGTKRGSDLGAVTVRVEESEPDSGESGIDLAVDRPFVVWLTSDLVGSTETDGRLGNAEMLRRAVEGRFREVTDDPDLTITWDEDAPRLVRPTRRDGWQHRWSLARPTLMGLAAGSVGMFGTSRAISAAQVHRALDRGFGDRCGEGFGRVQVDHPLTTIDAESSRTLRRVQSDRAGSTPDPLPDGLDGGNSTLIECWSERLAGLLDSDQPAQPDRTEEAPS